jgi:hypothetical protein
MSGRPMPAELRNMMFHGFCCMSVSRESRLLILKLGSRDSSHDNPSDGKIVMAVTKGAFFLPKKKAQCQAILEEGAKGTVAG